MDGASKKYEGEVRSKDPMDKKDKETIEVALGRLRVMAHTMMGISRNTVEIPLDNKTIRRKWQDMGREILNDCEEIKRALDGRG